MRATRILFSFIAFFLVGCQGIKGQAGYHPPVLPLKVTVDTNRKISFDLETEVEYPTPLGTFSVGVVVDPVEYFNKDHTLTVRIDCEDNFYDLHGKDFSIDFESGYYKKINLTKQGDNILLELRHLDENQTSEANICPIPTSVQNKNSDNRVTASNWSIVPHEAGSTSGIIKVNVTLSNNSSSSQEVWLDATAVVKTINPNEGSCHYSDCQYQLQNIGLSETGHETNTYYIPSDSTLNLVLTGEYHAFWIYDTSASLNQLCVYVTASTDKSKYGEWCLH